MGCKIGQPANVISIHCNTFDVTQQDPEAWAEKVLKETSAKVTVMKPGEKLKT